MAWPDQPAGRRERVAIGGTLPDHLARSPLDPTDPESIAQHEGFDGLGRLRRTSALPAVTHSSAPPVSETGVVAALRATGRLDSVSTLWLRELDELWPLAHLPRLRALRIETLKKGASLWPLITMPELSRLELRHRAYNPTLVTEFGHVEYGVGVLHLSGRAPIRTLQRVLARSLRRRRRRNDAEQRCLEFARASGLIPGA